MSMRSLREPMQTLMGKSKQLGRAAPSAGCRSFVPRKRGLEESPVAVHLLHDAGRNYTRALASLHYSNYLAFWQKTCCSYPKANSFLQAGGAKWPDTSKGIGANCVLR